MPKFIANPFRREGFLPAVPRPVADASAVAALLELCPRHAATRLIEHPELARKLGVARLFIKDERSRMGLGSFKSLGAAFVIARDAAERRNAEDWDKALQGQKYVTASAGNHGLSVAAGAALFGAEAVIYLSATVPETFANRLRDKGARVVREGATYEESMDAAEGAARTNGWTLLSDSTWPGEMDRGLGVMEGYTQLAAETVDEIPEPPTHIVLQAGVGGLAAAMAAYFRQVWGDTPTIIVVEPEVAPALYASIKAGALVTAPGPVSNMGRLDCKTASLVALAGLSKDADHFATITDEEAARGMEILAKLGLATTPSGGAGLAALIAGLPDVGSKARVLTILSEGPEDG